MTELEKLEKELLEEIQEEPEIYADTEEFCTINPETRIITVPTSKRILGTESDQETNRLYFKCPKIVGDNVDLSLFSLRINYQNAGNKKDQYLVEDVKVEGDNITFSWLFKRNVTAYKGNVKFILCAVKTTEDGIIKNEWNTTLNTECESLEGMEVDKVAVEEETKDIVEQLIAMMDHSAENAVRAVEEAKAEVDKEVGDFALKAQQALADVNNAGQAQTERVQTAGNDAVESIKVAQGTATRAVETAKTEAIQAIQAEGTTQAGNVSAEGEKQVQAVQGAAQEIMADREQIQMNKEGVAKLKEDITTQMEAKLDKQQGVENAGKVLVIGSDGNIVPGEVQGGSSEKQMELIESYAIEQSDTGFEIPIGSEYKDVLVEIKIKPREVAALRMKFDSQEVMFVTTGSYLGGSTLLQLFMHNYGGYADGWLKKISYETQISTNSFNSMKIKGMPNTITLTPWKSPSVIGVEAATAYVYAR